MLVDQKQDLEIFIMKLSPIIDIEKINTISVQNCLDVGVLEFERFTNLNISFTLSKTKKIGVRNFIVSTVVCNDAVRVIVYFQGGSMRVKKTSLLIDRRGRVVPNEMKHILSGHENEKTTWYGVTYTTNFDIIESECEQIDQNEGLLLFNTEKRVSTR